MQMMRILKAPFNSDYKDKIAKLCLVIPEPVVGEGWKKVMFDDGDEKVVDYIHLVPYKRWLNRAGGDVRHTMEKEMKEYLFRINWLSSKCNRIERSAEYKMLIKLYSEEDEEGLLESANNDLILMEKEIERKWASYHYCKFHIEDLNSEEALTKAEEIYNKKLKGDFWKSDFKPLPNGEVQTLF